MKTNIRNYVFEFETENEFGFNPSEIGQVIKDHNLDPELFYKTLGVNTCMSNERGETIIYAVDIEQTLRVLVEGKETPWYDWD